MQKDKHIVMKSLFTTIRISKNKFYKVKLLRIVRSPQKNQSCSSDIFFCVLIVSVIFLQGCISSPGQLDYARVQDNKCVKEYVNFQEYNESRWFIYFPNTFLWFAGWSALGGYTVIAYSIHTSNWFFTKKRLNGCPFIKN